MLKKKKKKLHKPGEIVRNSNCYLNFSLYLTFLSLFIISFPCLSPYVCALTSVYRHLLDMLSVLFDLIFFLSFFSA